MPRSSSWRLRFMSRRWGPSWWCTAGACGGSPEAAAEFSFLLAVIIIAGSGVFEARKAVSGLAAVGAAPLAASFVVAFASGIWSIRFLVALLKRGRFYAFAPYCWVVGVLTIAYALWRG